MKCTSPDRAASPEELSHPSHQQEGPQPGPQPCPQPGLLPRRWCEGCSKQTWVVTPDEALEIAGLTPSWHAAGAGKTMMIPGIHILRASQGIELICLESLLRCIF